MRGGSSDVTSQVIPTSQGSRSSRPPVTGMLRSLGRQHLLAPGLGYREMVGRGVTLIGHLFRNLGESSCPRFEGSQLISCQLSLESGVQPRATEGALPTATTSAKIGAATGDFAGRIHLYAVGRCAHDTH